MGWLEEGCGGQGEGLLFLFFDGKYLEMGKNQPGLGCDMKDERRWIGILDNEMSPHWELGFDLIPVH